MNQVRFFFILNRHQLPADFFTVQNVLYCVSNRVKFCLREEIDQTCQLLFGLVVIRIE